MENNPARQNLSLEKCNFKNLQNFLGGSVGRLLRSPPCFSFENGKCISPTFLVGPLDYFIFVN